MRRSVHIEPTGRIDLIGIRFRPHGAAALFPLGMSDLADRIEDLSDIAPPSCAPLLERVGNENGAARVGRLVRELGRQPWRAPDPRTGAAVRLIRRTGGNGGIQAVARTAGWSRRQLERAFQRDVGLAPKTLARIVRLQAMLRRAQEAKSGGWAALAAACGYADQAHFVREFRAFSGQTPSDFFRDESRLAQFFAGAA
jgi:AraC-like DNA-binding protein